MKKLDIVYEDKELLVINKEAGLLTVATPKEKEKTLFRQASAYVKKQFKNNKVFIVNRLDKDTSGIVVFTKNESLKRQLQDNWNDLAQVRQYYCLVEGKALKKGVIKQYLEENANYHSYVSSKGKLAITEYELISSNKQYSLLKVNIKTGRKNQIRVAMQSIGHPIVGDKKYGSTKNPIRRMCLHASLLQIINPRTKKELIFECLIPKQFIELVK